MRHETYAIDVPTVGNTNGTAFLCKDHREKVVQIAGTIDAAHNYILQITVDGTNWADFQTVNAEQIINIPFAAAKVRMKSPAAVAGDAFTATFAGFNSRCDG